MSQQELQRYLSTSPAVGPHLRGVYDTLDDLDSISLLIDLNEFNVFVVGSSDGATRQRWLCLIIGSDHSYFIDCLHRPLDPQVQQIFDIFATNGYSRLPPRAPCIGESAPALSRLSGQLCIYYAERVCAKTCTRPLHFTTNFASNTRLLEAWFRQYKSRHH